MEQGEDAYNNLEDKEPCHQRQFQARPLGYTLKSREKAQDDGEEHHEYSQENWGKDTRNDADDNVGQFAYPRQERSGFAELVDIGYDTNEGD
jgi:hypothetical protein